MKTNYNNKIIKNPSNIEIKVPDMEWKKTGRNVRPPASNENPQLHYRMIQFLIVSEIMYSNPVVDSVLSLSPIPTL